MRVEEMMTKKKVSRPKKKLAVKSPSITKTMPSMLVVLFDTETTGLTENRTVALDKQPEIIEFYGCLTDLGGRSPGKVIQEVDHLIKPRKLPLDPKIVKITGITSDLLNDKLSFSKHAGEVLEILERSPIVIAHNASFDRDMIEIEMERIEAETGEDFCPDWARIVCTVEQTIYLRGHRLSLSNLYEMLFSKKFEGAHRAKVDVAALTEIAVELHRREVL